MKHITSRLLALLLTAAMIISMAPAVYAADEDVTIVENEQPTVEETIVENSTEDTTVEPAKAVEANFSEGETTLTNYVTVNSGKTQYATLDEAIAAAEPKNGVITYTVTGKIEVTSTGTAWIQVLKGGLTGVTEVKFVGTGENAEISLTNPTSVLADQTYDINVSFENLKLSHPNGAWVGDLGHTTNYFACVLRNLGAANNTVTYTNCVFPNGACNNQYGKTVYDNCQFTNAASGKYNLWNYGGNTEVKDSTFTGKRGIKTYNEGTLAVAPTVAVENTTFTGLTEKAAIVASKATDITLDRVSATGCNEGLFQKAIEGSTDAEEVVILPSGSNVSGTFNVNGEKGVSEADNALFNVTAGKFDGAINENYVDSNANYDATTGEVTSGTTTANVAKVGDTYYSTLQEAINAGERKTVTLLANTRENVTINKAMTLDLNGYTLNGGTVKGTPTLKIDTARVTIQDSSEAQTGTIMREDTAENSGVSSHYVIDIQGKNALLTFNSGNVRNNSGNADGSKGASLVRVGNDSDKKAHPVLTIAGGTFTQDNFIVIKVDFGTLHLKGGTVSSKTSYAVENWLNANIKGDAVVNGAVSSWTYSGGFNSTLEISGGTVNGDVESVSYDGSADKKASVSITGGTVNGMLSTKRYDSTTVPGKDMATIEITGGTFSSDPSAYVLEGSSVTPNSDGTYGVAKAFLAKVGETSYYTMDEAFQAQTASGEPIVLLRDYTTGSPFNSGSIARTVDLNGHTWTCTGTDANSAAFEINYPNASLTVKNGKIVSSQLVGLIPSAMGGTITYDNSGLVFEDVEMSTTATSGIETNGNNTNDSVTLKNSTLNVPNGFGIYFPSSGTLTIDNSTINAKTMGVQVCAGSLSIKAGSKITVSGDPVEKIENDGAIQDGAAISIVNRTGYKGLGDITVTGGTFTAKSGNAAIKAYDWQNQTESNFTESAKVSVSGGTFSSIPGNMDDLCKDGYIPVKNADSYGVQAGTYVASIGTKKFTSLEAAVAAANAGDTVKLLADVIQNTMLTINTDITLDLNGKKIYNTEDIWSDTNQTYELISVEAKVTITGNGSIEAKENDCYTINVKNGELTIENGKFVGNVSVVQVEKGTLTINGGEFKLLQKWEGSSKYLINCIDKNYEDNSAVVDIRGGKFVDFDPNVAPEKKVDGKAPSFVISDGIGVTKDADGNFTAVPNMAAQIVDADGNSVAAYAGHYDAIAAAKDGETVILLSDRKNFVTNEISANITIDLNGKTLSVGNDTPFFRTNGEVTIQNGTITSNLACVIVNAYNKLTLKNVTITGVTGGSGKNLVNVCSNAEVTIDKDTVLTASGSGVAVFIGQDADAQYTLNVYGKVIQNSKTYAICGNGSYKGTSTINIYDGAEVKSPTCVAIYQPQAGVTNIYGGLVEGKCAIGIKSGALNISGGTVRGTVNDHVLSDENSSGNGISYDGSAIIVDSRATGYAGNVKINVTGGTVESCYSTAIREIGEQGKTDMTQLAELNVTGGNVLGASSNTGNVTNDMLVRDISVKNVSVSGGTFNHEVPEEYCATGYVPQDNGNGTYGVTLAPPAPSGGGSNASVGRPSVREDAGQSQAAAERMHFIDVLRDSWYYSSVYRAHENGLIDGVGGRRFAPDATLTVAQAIKLSAALHQLDRTGEVSLKNGAGNWYDSYVSYAIANGILEERYAGYSQEQMNAPVTRGEFVHILHGALEHYEQLNTVADNALPDVKLGDAFAAAIYELYRAGILQGNDTAGTFRPESTIKRSEAAAILLRMFEPSARKSFTLGA